MAGIELNIYQAAKVGDLETVKRLIQSKAVNVDEPGPGGATAIMLAAEGGNFEVVKWLIEEGKAKVFQDDFYNTVLHMAASSGNVKLFAYLVEKTKLSPHVNRPCGHVSLPGIFRTDTPLIRAMEHARVEMINYILDNYPLSDEAQNNIFKEAFYSIRLGLEFIQFMKFLFLRFFNKLDLELIKDTPSYKVFMAKINQLGSMLEKQELTQDATDIICHYGPTLNLPNPAWERDTILHRAIQAENKAWVYRLLVADVSPDIPNEKGITARMLAGNYESAAFMNAVFAFFDLRQAVAELRHLETSSFKSQAEVDKLQEEKRIELQKRIAKLYPQAKNILKDIQSIPKDYHDTIYFMLGFSLAPLDAEGQPLPARDPVNAYKHLRKVSRYFSLEGTLGRINARKIIYYLLLNYIDLVPGPKAIDPKEPVLKKGVLGFDAQPGLGLEPGQQGVEGATGDQAVVAGVGVVVGVGKVKKKPNTKTKEVRGLDESDDEEEVLALKQMPESKERVEAQAQVTETKESSERAAQPQVQSQAGAHPRPEAQDDLATLESIFTTRASLEERTRLATLEEMMFYMVDSGLEHEYAKVGNTVLERNIEEYLYGIGGWAKQGIAIEEDDPNAPKSGAEIYAQMEKFCLLVDSEGFMDALKKRKMILDMKAREAELLATIAALRGERLRVGGPEGRAGAGAGGRSYLPGFENEPKSEPKNEPKKEDQKKDEKLKIDTKP